MQILVFSFSHYNFVSVVIFLLFSPSLCFPSFSSFFSSAVTMRKQLCSTDNYITLRVCVCVCVHVVTQEEWKDRQREDEVRKDERKKRGLPFPDS